jgi:prepilin signal peptidase PulO-like enzyme (type II secretory pathway)
MTSVILFVFGAIIGSFLNVIGLRWRSGIGFGGRSHCPACGKTLQWWELLPIVSFLILRGRCSSCGTKISWQYPLIEIWTGIIFVTLPPWAWPVFCIYAVILIYDLRHKIIPDTLVYAAILLSLALRAFYLGGTLLDWLVGPIIFALFALGWLISRGRALGFGDAKLVLSIGLLLGAPMALSALALAFWIGTAVTLPLVLFKQKSLTIKSEIPFAPFLIIGAWASLCFGLDIFHVLSLQ